MNLQDVFLAAKSGNLEDGKAVFISENPSLPESKGLTQSALIATLGEQEVFLYDSMPDGLGKVFLGSTAFLREGMELCESFEEFVINVSGW